MSSDLSKILSDWPFEAGKLNVRKIDGDDGEPRIQIRLDLGILQMFADGRPDGQTPEDHESLLEYFEARKEETHAAGESRFSLSEEDCQALRDEAVQYYHRYMAMLALEDFEAVERDTTRNLRVLDLCARYAQTESDRAALEQFRPYITMIRVRAQASQALKDNEPKAAVHAIDEGLSALRDYYARADQPDAFEQSGEVQMLRGMREALVPKLPVSQRSELKARLDAAIAAENYELAAILRDELKMLKE